MLSPEIWLIAGVVFIIMEIVIVPGVGFLFAGLAAIMLGGLISANFLQVSSLAGQVAYFFFLTLVWWAILWKTLKKISKNKKGEEYKNLADAPGIVDDENGLTAGKIGFVKWSGAKMRARIHPASSVEAIKNGETIWVQEQKDGILLVDTAKHENK